jgi:hypothetical protein
MIMRTFVEALDFTGKTVLPFVTHAVSGMGRVADEYAQTPQVPPSATASPCGARRRPGPAARWRTGCGGTA